ncbi:NUDIX domain-containing protein [Streptomyces sp. NPDC087845]|uniref:NUDIX domain-containing protein n=1 Tax=Streptomyces sp. NPDC087845 TaxID=3365806 RepID=UPI0037FA0355
MVRSRSFRRFQRVPMRQEGNRDMRTVPKGGHVEDDRTLLAAALREGCEEAGIRPGDVCLTPQFLGGPVDNLRPRHRRQPGRGRTRTPALRLPVRLLPHGRAAASAPAPGRRSLRRPVACVRRRQVPDTARQAPGRRGRGARRAAGTCQRIRSRPRRARSLPAASEGPA